MPKIEVAGARRASLRNDETVTGRAGSALVVKEQAGILIGAAERSSVIKTALMETADLVATGSIDRKYVYGELFLRLATQTSYAEAGPHREVQDMLGKQSSESFGRIMDEVLGDPRIVRRAPVASAPAA